MSAKRKKNTVAMQQKPLLQAPLQEQIESDLPLNNIVNLLSGSGFQQIIPPPVEERKVFTHERLRAFYGSLPPEIVGTEKLDLVLQPTYFLSVFRNYLQKVSKIGPHVTRWFYIAPVLKFVDEQPHQVTHELGMFILGDESALANVQLLNSVNRMFNDFDIPDFIFEINTMGCPSCQKDYRGMLKEHLDKFSGQICRECNSLADSQPMRIWSCVNETCREISGSAPQMVDFLDEPCRKHFIGVLEAIDVLEIPYLLSPGLNRTLTGENFMFQVNLQADRKVVLGQGGNGSSLQSIIGENEAAAPMIGFLLNLEDFGAYIPEEKKRAGGHCDAFVISLGEVASRKALLLQRDLLKAGVRASEAMLENASIKYQLKRAADLKTSIALIVGQKEAIDDMVILRDMISGMQETFSTDRIIDEVQKRLGK